MKTKLLIAFVVLITFPAMSQLIISSNTTWTTNQVLTQSVIVQQGATLTINPGVQVQVLFIDNNSDLIGDVKLEIRGSLNVAGDACNKVNFLPFVTTSNKQYWTGIEIDTLATNCTISNATVRNALIGIKVENNSISINGLEIINSKLQGINVIGTSSSVSVNNSVIRGSDGEGVLVSNASSFSLINSKIRSNGTSGLSLTSVLGSTISNSVIYCNGKSGLFSLSSTTNISNCVIRKNTRMGILSSNSNITCQYSDVDSNSVDGLFIGGNSTLNMTNSSISNNQGFGVETSEYIFNTDFGNIIMTNLNPIVSINSTNFLGNHETSTVINTTEINGSGSYPFGVGDGGIMNACGIAVSFCGGGGSGNSQLLPFLRTCWGFQNATGIYNWINLFSIEVPFGMYDGFSGSVGRRNFFPGSINIRPKYGAFEEGSTTPFWTHDTPSSGNDLCQSLDIGSLANNDRIIFSGGLVGTCFNSTFSTCNDNSTIGYKFNNFKFRVGGYNYRSLINNTGVTDILTGNYWDTIVPTAVTNSVGAVLNLNGFVISEIVASHSNLSNSFIYSNASTFQLQQSSAPFCAGNTNYLIAPSGSYNYQWFNNGIPITNNNDSLLVSSNGIYSVLVSGSCTASSSPSTINIQSGNPITIVPSGATSFCAGNTVTLTSPSTTGNLWSNGATTQSIVVNSSGNYGLTVTNPQNCPSIAAPIQVNVIALPSSPVISSSGSTTFCENGSVFLTSNLPGNLLWSNGSTLQSISVNTSGTYNCQIISNGCASLPSNSIQVNVIPNPISTITPSGSTTFCQGNSVVLNVPLSAGNTYQWFNNGIAIPGALTNFYNATTTGNYSVFVTNNSSCSSSSSPVSVLSNPIPQAPIISANGSTSICQGNSISLNSNIPGTLWSNGSTNQTITVSQGGVYTAQASSNGCLSANSNAINVIVNPTPSIPVITASGPTTFCSGGTVTLNSSSSSGNQWSTNSTGQSITVNTSGSYTVTTTDINGCSSTSTPVTVTVNSIPNAPTISANGPTTFCSGGNVSLISSSPNGNNWSNSVSTQSNTITTSGTYYTTVTENGCTSAQSNNITITVNTTPTQPTISANGPTTFCSGNSVVLTSSASAGNLWSNNQISQSVTITSSGTYSVQVTNNGCSNTSNPITITVNQTPAAPIINTSGPTTFCQGSNVTLTTNATLGVTWTTSNGSQFQVPTLIVQSTQSSIYATVTQNGCTSSPSLPISTTVLPIGTPTFTQIQPVCAGEPFSLPSTSNNGYTGTWSPQVNNTSTTTYTFTPSAGQCANTQSMSVTVNALPQVSLAQFNDVCDTAGLVILSGGSPNGGVYSGTSISSNTFNTSIGLGTYPVTYTFTNNNGCTNEATQDLTVILCLGSGIDDLSDKSFTVYPNPTFDVIHVKTDFLVNETLVVFDQQGRLVRRFAIDEKETILDISELAPGVYTLQIGNHLQKTRLIKK